MSPDAGQRDSDANADQTLNTHTHTLFCSCKCQLMSMWASIHSRAGLWWKHSVFRCLPKCHNPSPVSEMQLIQKHVSRPRYQTQPGHMNNLIHSTRMGAVHKRLHSALYKKCCGRKDKNCSGWKYWFASCCHGCSFLLMLQLQQSQTCITVVIRSCKLE